MQRSVITSSFLVLFVPLFFVTWASAQDRGIVARRNLNGGAQPEQRVALVIGNGAYETAPLKNPVNDAKAMSVALQELGFDVTERENLVQKDMKREIQLFGQKLLKGGVGLFYYAGHAVQVNGRNYLIPVGAAIEHEKQVEYEAVDAGSVLSEMDYARNRLNIVILDACRDNPFARSFRSSMQGLASINAPTGSLIAYATAPGSVASDGPGDHGLYTGELIKTIKSPGMKLEDVFKQVRSAVREMTQGKQIPWESSSLEGDFYFNKPVEKPPEKHVEKPAEPETAPVVADRTVAPPAPRNETPPRSQKTWKEPITGIEFVWIPGGCFLMGSPQMEEDRKVDEGPVHEVCVDGFWIGRTEVTNGQYRKFDPSHNSRDYSGHSLNGDNQPAVYVCWVDANNFAQWLKGQNGGQYNFRLPTEAEWEYACRAGSESSRYWGNEPGKACDYENVADRTAGRQWGWDDIHDCDDGYSATAPVGSFQANPFGLQDMLGNVMEWVADTYSVDAYIKHDRKNPVCSPESCGPDRVIRGGHWYGTPANVRCANRVSGLPGGMNDNLGFRLVREP